MDSIRVLEHHFIDSSIVNNVYFFTQLNKKN